jgi:hypothetical protein
MRRRLLLLALLFLAFLDGSTLLILPILKGFRFLLMLLIEFRPLLRRRHLFLSLLMSGLERRALLCMTGVDVRELLRVTGCELG